MTSAASTEPAFQADPPSWFLAALEASVETGSVTVDGTPISYRAFGGRRDSGIVLVHGGAAHARWWDHIAPLLAERARVVAIDLSGHGDSGRRDVYTLDCWADEVLAAARDQRAFGPLRVYPTREAAIARFHPIPDQPALPYVVAHVAATSIRAVEGRDRGWSWKFDPRVFGRPPLTPKLLTRLDCRVALFRAEHGIVNPETSELMYDRLGRRAPLIQIPAAGHHVMLDHPIALVTGLRTLLADWDHSTPIGEQIQPRRAGS